MSGASFALAVNASLALLDAHPNLVLLRTFSKVYGLAGLRLGFALGSAADAVPHMSSAASAVGAQHSTTGCATVNAGHVYSPGIRVKTMNRSGRVVGI